MMETADIINREMTFYERVNQGKSNKTICLFDALNMIRKGEFQKEVTKVRELKIKDNIKGYRAYKKKLPAFLFTGICGERRRKREILFYTYFLIIDIDHVKGRIDIIRNQLKLDPFIISCWVSPSGEGLKALVELAYPENIDERNIGSNPKEIVKDVIYVESNTSTNTKISMLQQLLKDYEMEEDDIAFKLHKK